MHEEGVEWKDKHGNRQITKVLALICICDSPARCVLCEMTQFNGGFGCTLCLHPTVKARKEGAKRDVRVFPINVLLPSSRTHESTFEVANSLAGDERVDGVKGLSRLFLLPHFDIIKGMIPDSMHAAWLGVANQFMTLFFESPGKPFYIGTQTHVTAMDGVLLSVKPVNEMLRTPRSLKFRFLYKATEFRNCALFYSPVIFKDRLPIKYFKHWLLFVNAMRYLFQKKISALHIERTFINCQFPQAHSRYL